MILDQMPLERLDSVEEISRYLSAASNGNEGGVLVGKWEGGFGGGTNPNSWTGSERILSRFYYSGGRPVNYGQCWAFAGILVSLMMLL
jgi:transglutaminase 3